MSLEAFGGFFRQCISLLRPDWNFVKTSYQGNWSYYDFEVTIDGVTYEVSVREKIKDDEEGT